MLLLLLSKKRLITGFPLMVLALVTIHLASLEALQSEIFKALASLSQVKVAA